jgi:hypothetical protein
MLLGVLRDLKPKIEAHSGYSHRPTDDGLQMWHSIGQNDAIVVNFGQKECNGLFSLPNPSSRTMALGFGQHKLN